MLRKQKTGDHMEQKEFSTNRNEYTHLKESDRY
ncbi:MAG: hypothetical protein ACI9E5_000597, partial [Candidatus Omnitrophota bacterium]